jgi:Cu-processing system permease protein
MSAVLSVVGTEVRLAFRNRWILLSTGVLALFALALAFLGAGPSGALKADALTLTAASLSTLTVYLVPLIALLLTYDTVAGEVERGTLALVFATPIARGELMAGKFAAHVLVLAAAVAIGFGVAALAVVAVHGATAHGLAAWARLVGTAVLLGAVFVAIGTALSAGTRQTGTAAALAIGVWLVVVVLYDLALLGALIAAGDGTFAKTVFPWLVLANPGDAFRLYNLAGLGDGVPVAGLDGLAGTMPFPAAATLATLGAWLAAALAVAFHNIRRITP